MRSASAGTVPRRRGAYSAFVETQRHVERIRINATAPVVTRRERSSEAKKQGETTLRRLRSPGSANESRKSRDTVAAVRVGSGHGMARHSQTAEGHRH
jgi:hypothetical protein